MVHRSVKYSTTQWLAVEHLCHLDAVSDALASSVSLNVPVLAKIYNLAETMPSWQLMLLVYWIRNWFWSILSDLWDPQRHWLLLICFWTLGSRLLAKICYVVMLLCCSRASNPFYYYPKTWLLSFGLCNHINISAGGVLTVFQAYSCCFVNLLLVFCHRKFSIFYEFSFMVNW